MSRSSFVVAAVVACVATCEADDSVLRQGSRGDAVRAIQARLATLGYRIDADGIYGPKTAAAVKAFQRSRSLPGTGRVDAATRAALERPLQRGDRGAAVRALQRALNRLGAALVEDGVFGANTERAGQEALRQGHTLPTLGDGSPSTPAQSGGTTHGGVRPRPRPTGLSRYPSSAPRDLIAEAEVVLRSNRSGYRQDVFVVVDLSRRSSQPRLFVVEPRSGKVTGYRTSHGQGSDPRHTGRPQRFSNTNGSHMTSVGVYRTAETYSGKHGYSLKLDGLSGTNSRARSRYIVVHGASYVSEAQQYAGRSWGCFALDRRVRTAVIDRIKGGALLYAPDPSGPRATASGASGTNSQIAPGARGRVEYQGRTVSSAKVRATLQRIADFTGRTVRVTSGDRSYVPAGGSRSSLHLAHRAADFGVDGLSLGQTFELLRANRQELLGGGGYEVIWHQANSNTGGPHIHLGDRSSSSSVFKTESRGAYRVVP